MSRQGVFARSGESMPFDETAFSERDEKNDGKQHIVAQSFWCHFDGGGIVTVEYNSFAFCFGARSHLAGRKVSLGSMIEFVTHHCIELLLNPFIEMTIACHYWTPEYRINLVCSYSNNRNNLRIVSFARYPFLYFDLLAFVFENRLQVDVPINYSDHLVVRVVKTGFFVLVDVGEMESDVAFVILHVGVQYAPSAIREVIDVGRNLRFCLGESVAHDAVYIKREVVPEALFIAELDGHW